MAEPFAVRALEIHSDYVWDFDWVSKALRFIRDHGMTALNLHRNDIVDRVTYPSRYFGGRRDRYQNIFERYQDIHRTLYKYTPTRRSGPYQRRDYLNRIVDIAARWNIEVYLQNKELFFHDVFLELNPRLTKNGAVCPNEPFWWEFVDTKYRELLEDVPGIAGVITAPATNESRLSIFGNRCECELCARATPESWFESLLSTMYRPLHGAGKLLVVRDFVFDSATQAELASVMQHLPGDVVISLKNTPHDYYPSFPDNPRIGQVGRHRQWIEFDSMGQYFGWGIAPSIMIEDMRRRFEHARRHGADGILIRTDWESLDAHSSFHTPNLINLYAGAMLGRDADTPAADIYRAWLVEREMLERGATEAEVDAAARWAQQLFEPSWSAVRGALYTNACVFSDSSTYPVSADHAWWLAEEKNSLRDWDPSKWDAMDPSEENVQRMIAEKDDAVLQVERMQQVLAAKPVAFTESAYTDLQQRFDIFHRYVRGFRAIATAIALTKFLVHGRGAGSDFAAAAPAMLQRSLGDLRQLAEEFREFSRATDHRYTVYILLGWERLEALHGDLSRRIAATAKLADDRGGGARPP
jgi:hypothetical protein